ncbi:hypothetical protein Sjap_022225 [Stephania japonica]|uniref:Protein kinase domain-containing protein n=1 Tax=Stephania japonica TaxID=461633 RepID=A0AAP0EVS9_9MAGN
MSTSFLYLFVLVFHSSQVIVLAEDHHHHDHVQYSNITDRDALYALKANFNRSFLDANWSGSHCCFNDSSTWYGIQCLNNQVIGISLEGMGLSGEVDAHAFANLTELSSLSFKNNWISGTLMNFSSNTMLVRVDLSSNMFEGPISNSLLSLQMMESLQLQDNNLIGSIPGFSQKSLREFNVSNNNLSGKVPETAVLQSFSDLSYSGNSGLCGSPTLITCNGAMTMSESDESESNKSSGIFKGSTMLVIFIVLVVIAVVSLALFFTLCNKKVENIKQQWKKPVNIEVVKKNFEVDRDRDSKSNTAIGGENGNKRRLVFLDGGNEFELDDLLKASAEMLGKGNFGNVYKVILDQGQEVVVKRLRDLRPLSREEFVKRIQELADLKHPNLLSPLAYYYSREEKLLVYKFAAKGNLFNLIHGEKGVNRIPFKWSSRLRVAIEVARGMEFLHANMKLDNAIPHGNLKSSNVLLEENQKVLVSDHRLAASLITLPIAVQQMSAYKCPEYQHYRKVSRKSDVWCYGSLLLELLTGRVPSFAAPKGTNGVDLSSWAHRAVREEWTAEIFDPEISRYCTRRHEAQGMMKLLELALWCCDKSPEKRPDMHQVVREMGDMKVNELEDEEDLSSFDPSLTEDSISTNGSGIIVNTS